MAFHFGDLALDPERRELRSGTKLFAIEPQVFDLLVFLIRNRDRVVSRDDLLAEVWGGRIVSESAIGARINAARRAIGDDGVEQRWIRTIARKGFRFVGDVREVAGSGTLRSHPDAPAREAPNLPPRGQEITFCQASDGVNIAMACAGQGLPLVKTGHWMTHIFHEWRNPLRRPLLDFLADRYRLIRYDCRNNGLSDRNVADVSFEAHLHDTLGLRSYALLGISGGASIAIAHAARYPERVSKVVLVAGFPRGRNKLAEHERNIDVLQLLPEVSAPTLVLHGLHDKMVPVERGRQIASLIPNAKLVVLDSENHVPRSFEPAWPIFLDAIETFLSEP